MQIRMNCRIIASNVISKVQFRDPPISCSIFLVANSFLSTTNKSNQLRTCNNKPSRLPHAKVSHLWRWNGNFNPCIELPKLGRSRLQQQTLHKMVDPPLTNDRLRLTNCCKNSLFTLIKYIHRRDLHQAPISIFLSRRLPSFHLSHIWLATCFLRLFPPPFSLRSESASLLATASRIKEET